MCVSLSLMLVLFCFRFLCLRAAIPTDGTANILLIVADDTGLDAFSGYHVGFDDYTHYANTPNIDAIGTQGVRFHKAWSHPMCSPARASIYTGRHGFRHGITHPGLIPLSPTEETIAELISTTYVSGYFGKWHLGSTSGTLPTDQGFNYFSGALGNIEDYFSWLKTQVASENGAATTITETNYATTTNTNEALSWINQQTQVWFAVVAYNAAHSPFHVPPTDLYSVISLSGAPGTVCLGSGDSQANCFRAMVEAMDTSIGTLLQGLPSDDTFVIVVGDNGTPGNVVVPQADYPYSATHGKTTVYEGGVSVPLLMKYTGADAVIGLEVLSKNVYALDIFSTILEVAGITEPAGVDIDSSSLLSFVDSTRDAPEGRLTIFTELKNVGVNIDRWAIKTTSRKGGVYKYIDNEGTHECYSLTDDDAELVNIYTKGTNACNRLRNARSNFQLDAGTSALQLKSLNLALEDAIETLSSPETMETRNVTEIMSHPRVSKALLPA